eukprot:m51a1_g4780 putative -domain-containing protein (1476) ;mRNA; r:45152-50768
MSAPAHPPRAAPAGPCAQLVLAELELALGPGGAAAACRLSRAGLPLDAALLASRLCLLARSGALGCAEAAARLERLLGVLERPGPSPAVDAAVVALLHAADGAVAEESIRRLRALPEGVAVVVCRESARELPVCAVALDRRLVLKVASVLYALPDGWSEYVQTRPDGHKHDHYWFSPTGMRLRSTVEVRKLLADQGFELKEVGHPKPARTPVTRGETWRTPVTDLHAHRPAALALEAASPLRQPCFVQEPVGDALVCREELCLPAIEELSYWHRFSLLALTCDPRVGECPTVRELRLWIERESKRKSASPSWGFTVRLVQEGEGGRLRIVPKTPTETTGCCLSRKYGDERLLKLSIPLKVAPSSALRTAGLRLLGCTFEFLFGRSRGSDDEGSPFSMWFFLVSGPGFPRCDVQEVREWCLSAPLNAGLSLAKLQPRMELLASPTDATALLHAAEVTQIPDIVTGPRVEQNLTDGCGLISYQLMQEIAQMQAYEAVPTALQIRLLGAKGLVMLAPELPGRLICLRNSQVKFVDRNTDEQHNTVQVCKASKDGGSADMNHDIITALQANGLPFDNIVAVLEDEFRRIRGSIADPREMLRRGALGSTKLAARVVEAGFSFQEPFVLHEIERLLTFDSMATDKRLRVPVEQSRYALIVADPTQTLAPGECFFQPSSVGVLEADVLVTRHPLHLPTDLVMLRAVDCQPLRHCRDVLVLSTRGAVSPASLMSGGDYDGDRAFVCWDRRLIPDRVRQRHSVDGCRAVEPELQRSLDEAAQRAEHYISPLIEGTLGELPRERIGDALFNYSCEIMKHDAVGLLTYLFYNAAERDPLSPDALLLGVLCEKSLDSVKQGYSVRVPREVQRLDVPEWRGGPASASPSPSYCTRVFRAIKRKVQEVRSMLRPMQSPDPAVLVAGWQEHVTEARKWMRDYNDECRSLTGGRDWELYDSKWTKRLLKFVPERSRRLQAAAACYAVCWDKWLQDSSEAGRNKKKEGSKAPSFKRFCWATTLAQLAAIRGRALLLRDPLDPEDCDDVLCAKHFESRGLSWTHSQRHAFASLRGLWLGLYDGVAHEPSFFVPTFWDSVPLACWAPRLVASYSWAVARSGEYHKSLIHTPGALKRLLPLDKARAALLACDCSCAARNANAAGALSSPDLNAVLHAASTLEPLFAACSLAGTPPARQWLGSGSEEGCVTVVTDRHNLLTLAKFALWHLGVCTEPDTSRFDVECADERLLLLRRHAGREPAEDWGRFIGNLCEGTVTACDGNAFAEAGWRGVLEGSLRSARGRRLRLIVRIEADAQLRDAPLPPSLADDEMLAAPAWCAGSALRAMTCAQGAASPALAGLTEIKAHRAGPSEARERSWLASVWAQLFVGGTGSVVVARKDAAVARGPEVPECFTGEVEQLSQERVRQLAGVDDARAERALGMVAEFLETLCAEMRPGEHSVVTSDKFYSGRDMRWRLARFPAAFDAFLPDFMNKQ